MRFPPIPPPPWKDAYHHASQTSMVVLGLNLGLCWENLNIPLTVALSVVATGLFLLSLAYYIPMWCYTPTRFWVILAVGLPLYLISSVLESIDVIQITPAIGLMIFADRLLNYVLAYVRTRKHH